MMRKGNLPTLKIVFNPIGTWKYSVDVIRKHVLTRYLSLLDLSHTFFFSSLKDSIDAKMFLLLKKDLNLLLP